jgi:hypothetical protein
MGYGNYWQRQREAKTKQDAMMDAPFEEQLYLAANPDVASAVESGAFVSGSQHFQLHGYDEGRDGAPAPPAPAAPPPKAPKPQSQNQQQLSTPNGSSVNQTRENAKKAKGKQSTLLTKYGSSSRARTSTRQQANEAALGLSGTKKSTLGGSR